MKKDKSKNQAPAEFNNNPFKSLKSFKPQPGSAGSKQPPARKKEKKEKEDEAAELFLRAVSGARSLHAETDEQPAEVKRSMPAEPKRGDDEEQEKLFLQAMRKIGTSFRHQPADVEEEEAPRQSSSSRMKQLKRGVIRIREELDLHGCLRDQALVKLEHFISSAHHRGYKAVLVITGKGINSPEGPVLQGAVADWLQRKGRAMVAEFAQAPADRGGSGAYVVFLRSR